MLRKLLICLAVVAIAGCSPARLLGGAFIKDAKVQQLEQSRYELELGKYTAFFCAQSKPLTWNVQDHPFTVESIKQHNMKWEVMCLINQRDSQPNNGVLEDSNLGFRKMPVIYESSKD